MPKASRLIGILAAVAITALIVVGIASGEIVRHVIQTLPFWPAVVLGLRGSPAARWAGLPVFVFWLAIMTLIWLFLLGIANIANGAYGPVEIAMTAIVGIASIVGIVACILARGDTRAFVAAALFILIGAAQVGIMAVSLKPPVSSDRALMTWWHSAHG